MSGSIAFAFRRDGFVEPFRLFTADDCRVVASHFKRSPPASYGSKVSAAKDRFVRNLATHPRLLSLLAKLIGDSIVLWGASYILREPGDIHPWHTDIEFSAPEGRFASVWIGLENTCRESALRLVARSHSFGKTIQQVMHEHEVAAAWLRRYGSGWAKDLDAKAGLVQFDMTDGDALVFDGRLWHAGPNNRRHGARTALLLQYAAVEMPVAHARLRATEWPFRFKNMRAPVILLRGEARE